jgi:hypothetical protein
MRLHYEKRKDEQPCGGRYLPNAFLKPYGPCGTFRVVSKASQAWCFSLSEWLGCAT